MTPNEHDNPETYEELTTTEVYRFSATGHRAADDPLPGMPAMEQLPDPDALPDPGFPVMPAPAQPAPGARRAQVPPAAAAPPYRPVPGESRPVPGE
jgi:hypothetical protein